MGRDALELFLFMMAAMSPIVLLIVVCVWAEQQEPQVEVRYVITTCPAEERVDF